MFLLDSNVVSELRKSLGRADPNVVAWADSTAREHLFLSVVVVEELEIGVLLAARRNPAHAAVLRAWLDLDVVPAFAGRILPIDVPVARRSAALHVPRTRPIRDGLIAATALVYDLTVVTRNAADFLPMGVSVLNPWVRPGTEEAGRLQS